MLKPEIPVTSIDPDGDLYLRIGQKRHGGARDFKVCSATMRRSSPVWKSMLFGPWTEAKPTQGDWIVELPEDSAEVLKILLSIVHGRFEVVPKNIALTLLYDMLIVTDKYDMISVIRPWANDWVRSVKDPAPIFLTGHEQLKRTYTAWELGCDGVVDEQMICFIFGLACHDRSFSYKGIPIFLLGCHNGPPDLVGKSNYLPSKSAYILTTLTHASSIEVVTNLRISLIQTILDFYHAQVACRIPSNSACSLHTGYYANDGSVCDSVILGGIWRHFESAKQDFPPKQAAQYQQSANDLLHSLSAMFKSLPCLQGHNNCGPGNKFIEFEKKTRADQRWKNVLQPHHKKRLAEQRTKTGLAGP
jgi:hypothetical protein